MQRVPPLAKANVTRRLANFSKLWLPAQPKLSILLCVYFFVYLFLWGMFLVVVGVALLANCGWGGVVERES